MKKSQQKQLLTICTLIIILNSGCMRDYSYRKILNPLQEIGFASELEGKCYILINEERKKQGLKPLQLDYQLKKITMEHTKDMVRMACISHQGIDNKEVSERANTAHIDWEIIGENIARNKGYSNPVNRAVKDWMNSKGHRANILNKEFTHTAISITKSKDGFFYFTQVFMKPIL